MATITIDEQFDLAAEPEVVWRHLIDAERIALCLPGAAIEEKQSETMFLGNVVVKVGSVRITYRGTVEFEDVDHAQRSIRLRGTGREKTGSGSARMSMTSRVTANDSGGSSVGVSAQIEVAGKMVRFGRGMIERLSQEIFKEFVACLSARLQAEGRRESAAEEASAEPGAHAPPLDEPRPPELRPVRVALRILWERLTRSVRALLGRDSD